MKTLVVTTEKKLMQALSRVVSLDPIEQIKWVENAEVPEAITMLDRVSNMGMESDLKFEDDLFGEGFLIAPVFMVVVTHRDDGFNREIREVYFEETAGEAEDMIWELFESEHYSKGMFRVFMYKEYEGFVEIPFEMGYYITPQNEGKKEIVAEYESLSDVPTVKPECVYFEDSMLLQFVGMNSDVDKDNITYFVEIPAVWDAEYIGCPCCGEKVQEVYAFKNAKSVLYMAQARGWEAGFDCEMKVSNLWYEYQIKVDEDRMAEEEELDWDEQPWSVGANALEKATKIIVRKKF